MTNRLEKGDRVPKLTLPATDQQTVDLSAPNGTGHVLFFYPKDNTKGCTTEAKAFSELKSQFDALGYSIIGISRDSLASHDRFREKQELTIALASDEAGEACEAFGVWVEKKMYGKTFMGIERSTFVVESDGTVSALWRKVRVNGHSEAVLEALSNS
ncbi:MAG: peroxiredoxin [Pseudomonadota bacterium]